PGPPPRTSPRSGPPRAGRPARRAGWVASRGWPRRRRAAGDGEVRRGRGHRARREAIPPVGHARRTPQQVWAELADAPDRDLLLGAHAGEVPLADLAVAHVVEYAQHLHLAAVRGHPAQPQRAGVVL